MDGQCPTLAAKVSGYKRTGTLIKTNSNMKSKIFTPEIKAQLAALTQDEQLWLSEEFFLVAMTLRRRAFGRKPRAQQFPVPRMQLPPDWMN